MLGDILVVIRGGGDQASGVIHRLFRCGMKVVVLEQARPTVIRRAVAFASAVYDGEIVVEGVKAVKVTDISEAREVLRAGDSVPVLVDPEGKAISQLKPQVVVDATMRKKNLGTRITDAPLVIGLGPGFTAGVDVHKVIETNWGHDLGRVIEEGSAEPDTGIPDVFNECVLRAPCDGVFTTDKKIGMRVKEGEIVGYVSNTKVTAEIYGVIRGLLKGGLSVKKGAKLGDIDPRGEERYAFTISEKARAIGGGVLEAILVSMKKP
ncbi:MAG: selenium-dependent molybdenum cofactor biosynthesis protein YqeB [Candidatus Bathyarchaeia archaeon]